MSNAFRLAGPLALSLLSSCASEGPSEGDATPARHPNLVVFLTDDQGFGDFGHAGHPALSTPHLDRLAAESPRVERFYVSPVCSPTRASLLTGRYNYRTRVVDTWVGRSMMEPEEVTLAEVLRDAGYATGIFGKWHLGDCFPLRPTEQGFETALIHRGGGIAQPSEPPANGRRYTDPILLRDGVEVETEGYCTDVYVDAALGFIDAALASDRPFFAYVPTNAPHGPFHDVPQESYDRARARDLLAALPGDPAADDDRVDREARIVAMVENIDQNVGRMLAHLEARGIAEDTVFVFLNDNGPVWGRYTAGLRGYKTGVYEGGIRTPLFVRWPGRLSPDTVVADAGAHIDLLPTLLEAVGVEPPAVELDGRSFFAQLAGDATRLPERSLFLQTHRGDVPAFEHHFAVVGPRYKLVRASGFGRKQPPADHPFELFDLLADPGEAIDLAAAQPERVARMRAEYRAWFEDVSSTRADNYAPPRIVVGDPRETRTVLTRQDWRAEDQGGWGQNGTWQLRCEHETERTGELLFTKPADVARVLVRVDDDEQTFEPERTGATIEFGRVRLPARDFALRVVAYDPEGALVPIHQVALSD